MLSDQWFVAMRALADPAIEVAKSGKLKHVPDRFEKIYLHWLENIKDWCISRQLWWGHRIPAYYCDLCGEMTVSASAPEKCPKCGGAVRQDEDVLDTWFSSALWPFSTLGWPEETEDLKYFYPTDVLVTGYDIIFFWVARMVFAGLFATKESPFEYVYVHGLVRDAIGQKMSKSLGNGIDPLEIIDQYGADALRFMLTTGISPGNDMRFKTDRLESSRNFANKLWNASRFVIMNLLDENGDFKQIAPGDEETFKKLRDEDKWALSKVNEAAMYVTNMLDKFELALAAQKVYEAIWNEYCDWYIELVKSRLYGGGEEEKAVCRYVLVRTLKDLLKMLHPFMPFITEEIWSYLPKEGNKEEFLMKESWPCFDKALEFAEETRRIEATMEAIKSIRNIRAEAEAAPARKLRAYIFAAGGSMDYMKAGEAHIKNLAGITEITYLNDKSGLPEEVMSAVTSEAEIFIPLDDLLDYRAEFERLTKEKERLLGETARIGGKLANEGFVSKAPEKVINDEREKLAKYREMLEKVTERLALIEKKI
jgi:valyl-tRNA synthetase